MFATCRGSDNRVLPWDEPADPSDLARIAVRGAT